MYIKQCLHMLTILSVVALLGPVSSIWLCISLVIFVQIYMEWFKHAFFVKGSNGAQRWKHQNRIISLVF